VDPACRVEMNILVLRKHPRWNAPSLLLVAGLPAGRPVLG
jgi:hypothetical protein